MGGPARSAGEPFAERHLGPRARELPEMLGLLGTESLEGLMDRVVPEAIRWRGDLRIPAARSEVQIIEELREIASRNQVLRSFIGMGYHGTHTPPIIQRNILENPGWYTQYTPYQAEISQGRMEALLNFQTMVLDLCAMEVANSSLLDEATAAAEAMTLSRRVLGRRADARETFLVSSGCHPQTIAVVRTRAEPLGIRVRVQDTEAMEFTDDVFGALLSYPDTAGRLRDLEPLCKKAHGAGALVSVTTDLLALTLLRPPGESGADIVVGNSQRFGVPLGYGGPHAAFMATRSEYRRQMPGRIVGLSRDAAGKPAVRLALQTREQHIRREKATSNICTAQVLLAVMASMYGVYHGPDGLRAMAERIRQQTTALASGLSTLGCTVEPETCFDTLGVRPSDTDASAVITRARDLGINLRTGDDNAVGISLDETTTEEDLRHIFSAFGGGTDDLDLSVPAPALPGSLARTTPFMEHPVFHDHRSETELLRYMHRLQARDLSLTTSMIPLGSCTMKLNATAEMVPVSFPGFAALHPFAPVDQAAGYQVLHERLSRWLEEITGFAATSLQPNAGSQGEYAGLLLIRAYHRSRGKEQRDVCLIPSSAHGTNPASATMAGMEVVVVACDDHGNIDVADLRKKAETHRDRLAALMVTYPSTHGVFEAAIQTVCTTIHDNGGQVYMDGANLNAQVGLMRPADLGADVCHLNLHKTFCIPHGGGGPGMGPICVAEHLAPFLPGHPVIPTGGETGIGAIASAPWGSPSILPISYAYIAMMGPDGLERATQIAILNANYIAHRLKDHYPVLYTGQNGLVAHECILDLRHLKASADIQVTDVAKRLIDYGFHAPTVSFPVAGTLMVEPTESESKQELDRFCDAMISIRQEVREIEEGNADRGNNLLKGAPHTAEAVCADIWDRPYSRERAAFPNAWTRQNKFWPPVARIDEVFGDRNLVCTCPPVEAYG